MRKPWRKHAIVQLTLMRFREFIREPEALFWALIFPILLSAGLGIAFRSQPADTTGVAAVTPQIAAWLGRDPHLAVMELSSSAASEALRTGKVLLVVEPAANGGVVYRYDDTNPDARTARATADRAVQIAAGRTDPVTAADDVAREAGSRYIDFLIPGLVGMGIMGNGIWNLAFSIVDARRRKLVKRLIATPMRKQDYLLSFLLWRMVLLPVEVAVPIAFGAIVFGVPLRGSILDIGVFCVLGSLTFSSIGLLIASRPRTIEAVAGFANLVMVPMWIVSGVFFSSQRFPTAIQPLIRFLPLTALNDALRANMLQGAGLAQLLPQAAALGVYLVVCFGLALRLFRWR